MEKDVPSESAMRDLGKAIGERLKGGEVIELIGDIGAGKTTLTKGIAQGLGVDEDVQSPSFTISRTYDAGRDGLRLAHYDFYRLHDPGIMADELAEVMHDTTVVTIVEWAEIVANVLADNHIRIRITPTAETMRRVIIEGIAV